MYLRKPSASQVEYILTDAFATLAERNGAHSPLEILCCAYELSSQIHYDNGAKECGDRDAARAKILRKASVKMFKLGE